MSRKLKDEGHTRTMSKFKEKRMDRSESERDSGFSGLNSCFCVCVFCVSHDETERRVSHRLSCVFVS